MNFLKVALVVLVAYYGVDAEECADNPGYGPYCEAYKSYCGYSCATWGDGVKFWKKCKKTCNKCEGEKKKEEKKKEEVKEEDTGCKDDYSTGMCEKYKHICKCGTFSDGTKLWSVCKKTCGCCDEDYCGNKYGWGKKKETEEEKKEEEEAQEEKDAEDSGDCTDEYGGSCNGANEGMCKNGQWSDGTAFWTKCKKSCGCCSGNCDAEEKAKQEACGDKVAAPSKEFFNKDSLDKHNELRALHKDTPAMTWDTTLEGYAQSWSESQAKRGKFEHSTYESRGNGGENIYLTGMLGGVVCSRVGSQATQAWYDEIKDWIWATGKGKPGTVTGHFTQVVWKASTKLGCGWATDAAKKKTYVTCVYSTAGNFNNQYLSQVGALKSSRVLEKRRDKIEGLNVITSINKRGELVAVINEEIQERKALVIDDSELIKRGQQQAQIILPETDVEEDQHPDTDSE